MIVGKYNSRRSVAVFDSTTNQVLRSLHRDINTLQQLTGTFGSLRFLLLISRAKELCDPLAVVESVSPRHFAEQHEQ